jgi:hypothetical protein
MWWECSECGGHIEHASAPVVCLECGMAGVIFVRADTDDAMTGDAESGSMRAVWLRAGLEGARNRARHVA